MPEGKNATSKKKHLYKIWKHTGKKPQELIEQPVCPPDLKYLWKWYLEIQKPGSLTFTEIKDWAFLTNRVIESFEAKVLKRIDSIHLEIVNGRSLPSNNQGKQQ